MNTLKQMLAALALVAVVGCATEQRDTGLIIISQKGAGPIGENNVREYFNAVSTCITGDRAVDPQFTLILTPEKIQVGSQLVRGASYLDERPIAVYLYHPEWQSEDVALSVLSHEIVHVVLELIGEDTSLNASHNLPGFECGY